MKVVVFVVLIFALASAIHPRRRSAVLDLPQEVVQQKIFASWKSKFNKVYASPEEETFRFENFKASLVRIEQKNKLNPVFGLTKFSDLTPEEFQNFLGYVPRNVSKKEVFKVSTQDAPATYDWRNQDRVTPVKDQGQCGSCWAFSVTENIESIYMIANNLGSASMPALSPQEIVDCDTTDAGCNGGDPPTAYKYVISAGGMETDSDYPYTAQDGTCAFDSTKVKVQISNWKYATTSNSETDMQNAMISVGPLSICVDATSWQDYSGGVLLASQCTTNLDHCVQAVGWDTTASTPFWSVRNSWGADWGENGYIRLEYGQDTCGLATEATSSCISC